MAMRRHREGKVKMVKNPYKQKLCKQGQAHEASGDLNDVPEDVSIGVDTLYVLKGSRSACRVHSA